MEAGNRTHKQLAVDSRHNDHLVVPNLVAVESSFDEHLEAALVVRSQGVQVDTQGGASTALSSRRVARGVVRLEVPIV